MAINYTLVPRSSSLKDADAPWRVFAVAQSTRTVTLREIAQHLARHNSPFSEGTIIGLLTDANRCILEHLTQGARVELDEFGTFYTTLHGRGARSADEFTTDLIDDVCIRWKPSRETKFKINGAHLEYVINRADMRQLKKRTKQELDEEIAASRQQNADGEIANLQQQD